MLVVRRGSEAREALSREDGNEAGFPAQGEGVLVAGWICAAGRDHLMAFVDRKQGIAETSMRLGSHLRNPSEDGPLVVHLD